MRGVQPAPTALKILKGARPCRINKSEAKPKSASGTLPPGWGAHMSDGAKRFWSRYAPILSTHGLLTEADLPALRIMAELWSKWVRVQRTVNRKNIKPEVELPYMRLADKLETQLLRYLQQFGMTASSRGRITVGGQDADEDEGFLD